MVSPLAAGALAITLQPGIPTLLTEYAAGPEAPLTIINLSSSQLVYVAADSSLNTNNAVPIAPGTNVPWQAPGQVWGLVPAGGAATTVVITSAVGIVPAIPAAQPTADTWALTLAPGQPWNATYTMTETDPGQAWGSTIAYTNIAITNAFYAGGVTFTVNLVVPSLNNYKVALASGAPSSSNPLNTNTTVSVPKLPYIVQLSGNGSASGQQGVSATVQLAPT